VWLRRRFWRSGLVIVTPGRPGVRVANLDTIEVENVAFFPGVRLECWRGARIFIGNGTYPNRNTKVIAAREVHIGRDCMIAWDVVMMDTDQHGIGGSRPAAQPVSIVTHDAPQRAIVTGSAAATRASLGHVPGVAASSSKPDVWQTPVP
jgi:acetyltransferase-like isoleucine patch superfamily enzyme